MPTAKQSTWLNQHIQVLITKSYSENYARYEANCLYKNGFYSRIKLIEHVEFHTLTTVNRKQSQPSSRYANQCYNL